MRNQSNIFIILKEPILFGIMAFILLNFGGYAIYGCYLLVPIFIFVLKNNLKLVDANFFYLLFFSILYTLCLIINGFSFGDMAGTAFIGYLIFPTVFYFLGKHVFHKYPSTGTVLLTLFFISFFFSLLPFFDNVKSVLSNGFMSVRSINYSMREDVSLSATITGGYFALNMTLLPILFTQKNSADERKLALFSLYLFTIGLFAILNMSNRTGLFIMALAILSFFIITGKRIKSALLLVFFITVIIVLYVFDIWGFQSWFEHSRILYRISQTGQEEHSRFRIWALSIKGLIKYPFGFEDYDINAVFSHNLWLDVGRRAGILPMIPLLVFTYTTGASILKISFSNQYSDFFKVLIAGFGIGFIGTFFVEPALEGFYIMFYFFCFYAGMMKGINEFKPVEESIGDHQQISQPRKLHHANLRN